jgi:Tfp pilus assembly protein PilF
MVSVIKKIMAAYFVAALLFTLGAFAAGPAAAESKEIDRFNVKSKDLSKAKASKDEDFPMPDFKETGGGENFTDDIFDEDDPDADSPKHAKKPAAVKSEKTPKKAAAAPVPRAEVKTTVVPPMPLASELPAPVADSPASPAADSMPAAPALPTANNGSVEDMLNDVPPAPAVPAAEPAEAPAALPAADSVPPPSAAEVAPAPAVPGPVNEAQSEQEIAEYSKLKAHLLNFLKGAAGQAVAAKVPESGAPAANENVAQAAPLEPAPAVAPAPGMNPQDDLSGLFPPSEGGAANAPAPLPEAAPVAPAEEKPAEVAPPAVVAKAPEAAPVPPAPVVLKEEEKAKPEAKPKKLSEADKQAIEKIDEKAKNLPENKKLSNETLSAINKVKPSLSEKEVARTETEYIDVEHGKKPEGKNSGMNVSVKDNNKNGKNENVSGKLDLAYRALLSGQIAAAVSIYKEVLDVAPDNKDALFGLATAYHRDSQFDQARAIYTKILEKDPNNKEVLNNFLVLVAEESPDAALLELQKIEKINSDFSPVPAQIAMIYLKKNDPQKAERYLKRAVLLSPDNVTYQYNLAITSDRLENYPQAIKLYKQIVEAVKNGAVIPGSLNSVEERLAFLQEKK